MRSPGDRSSRHDDVAARCACGTSGSHSTHVQWLPFTTAPGSWNPLPDPPRIPVIAAKSTVTIDVPWTTPASLKLNDVEVEHFCVNARIDRFRNR